MVLLHSVSRSLLVDSQSLYHHGILGMHWGIRRFQPYPKGHVGGKEIGKAAKDSKDDEDSSVNSSSEKRSSVSDMSNDELREKINRLELEKRYQDLSKPNDELREKINRLELEKRYKDLLKPNDELRERISRLELEKRYSDLTAKEKTEKENKGKKFVMDILSASAKNIGIQVSNYLMAKAVNKISGEDIVKINKNKKGE